jgi:alcohol dehydrogenase
MSAIQFTVPTEINLIACEDVTQCAADEAIVRTHRMGICGTDLSGYLGKMPFFSYPRIPGHELGLEVLAVGENVTNVRVGDRCSLEPYINDPNSTTSLKGNSNCCPGVQVLGVHANRLLHP